MSDKSFNYILIAFLVISGIGILDALYLTSNYFSGGIPPCTTGGCETVLTSIYATVFGFPVSLFGLLYYLSLFTLITIYRERTKYMLLTFAFITTSGGLLFTLYLLYLQFFVIEALCQYCLLSAAITTTLFILNSVLIWAKKPAAHLL